MIAKKILPGALALLLALPSPFSLAIEPAKAVPQANSYTEDKLNIVVTPKQPEFTIKLTSNPTTGYSWFLREYNADLVVPIKHSFEKPSQNLAGAPTHEVWTFRVKPLGFTVPQQTTLRFVYARPWQGGEGATQLMFHVTTMQKE